MVYADTNFFIALIDPNDALHQIAKKIYNTSKEPIETSLLAIAEIFNGCEKHGMDPEVIAENIFEIAIISGINQEQAITAARYMKNNKLKPMDALHCALAGKEIISADRDIDKIGIKRIW
jgi:predicted nucleic acid-binding protein